MVSILQANDSRKFVIAVNLVKKRTLQDVKKLMAPAETLQAGLDRVRKQVSPLHNQFCGQTAPHSGLAIARF